MGHDHCHRENGLCYGGCPDCSNISEQDYKEKKERFEAQWRKNQAIEKDSKHVDAFARAMKAKLAEKTKQGRGGWDNKKSCSQEFLSTLLREHVEKGDPIDVANFCMMLHQRGDRIRSALSSPVEERMKNTLLPAALEKIRSADPNHVNAFDRLRIFATDDKAFSFSIYDANEIVEVLDELLSSASPVEGGTEKELKEFRVSAHEYAMEYEFRADEGDYVPTDGERAMIEDAINGFLGENDASPSPSAEIERLQKIIRDQKASLLDYSARNIRLNDQHDELQAEIEALRVENELLGYANVYRIEGVLELGSADIDNLEEVVPWAKDFEEHVGIVEIRLLPDTAGKSGADVFAALQQQGEGK